MTYNGPERRGRVPDTPPNGVLVERIANLSERVEQVRAEIREDIGQLRQDIAGMSFVDQQVYTIQMSAVEQRITNETVERERFEKDVEQQIIEGAEKRTLATRLAVVSLILAAVLPLLSALVVYELSK